MRGQSSCVCGGVCELGEPGRLWVQPGLQLQRDPVSAGAVREAECCEKLQVGARHGVKIPRDIQAPLILKLKVPENVPSLGASPRMWW